MKVGIFDLETSGLWANTGILLCCVIQDYATGEQTTLRADHYGSWDRRRTNQRQFVKEVLREIDKYDILVAHNGQWYDKRWLNALALKYEMKPVARWKKFIDPVKLGRNHLQMYRHSLNAYIEYFDIEDQKTPIEFRHWLRASFEGNRNSMDIIVHHCRQDVKALRHLYDIERPLIDKIDNRGSGG